MNYQRIYDQIIENRKINKLEGYKENHHIIPRSLGGTNDTDNIVKLTAREHFICHVLPTKFTTGTDRHKMLYAANMMSQISRDYQSRYIPKSKIYEMLKKEFGQMHSTRLAGKQLTVEHRNKISQSLKGRVSTPETIQKRVAKNTGKKRTPEQKERMSLAQKGKNPTQYTVEQKIDISKKISKALKGKPKSKEHKQKLSDYFTGRSTGKRSEATKQKMRKPKSEAHRRAISEGRKAKYASLKEQKC